MREEGAVVVRQTNSTPSVENISRYLAALGKLCAEVAADPRLLPTFLAILTLVPSTIRELQRSRRLAA